MNNLLKRQLKKHFGDNAEVPAEWRAFVGVVEQAYEQFDSERAMLERSLDLSSSELLVTNSQLRCIVEELRNTQDELEKKVAERTTELRESNDALALTEARFRLLVEQIPAVTYMADAGDSGAWRYASPQIEALTGFAPEEWLAVPGMFRKQLHADDHARVLAEGMRCRDEGKPFNCEYRLFAKDGRVVWCRDQAVIRRDEETGQQFIQGIIQDITSQKNLEDQLRQSLKMEAIGKLAGGIAHDFNNILTAIIGDSYLISAEVTPQHAAHKHAESILNSANRAAALTQQLLAYSRRQMLQPKVFDLNALIIKLETMLRRLIGEHIQLNAEQCAGQVFVKADPTQIEQVIINLVINSRDAMLHGGKISILTARDEADEHVNICITDNGTGMSAEVLSHLFEPFYTTKPQGKGTGLGLATCYGTIKQSGGSISVESEIGRGTTFKIILPCVQSPTQTPTQQTNHFKKMATGTETILIAEDEDQVNQLAALTLRHLGYTVLTAMNGEAALDILDKNPPPKIDLVLTDVIMPLMGGKELAKKIHARNPELPVLFMSGYTADEIGHDELMQLGKGFLQKPFSPVALAEKIRERFVNR